MSDSTEPSPIVPTASNGIGPRRLSTGVVVSIEQQRWPDHPKNAKYLGSENTAVNDLGVNVPTSPAVDDRADPPDHEMDAPLADEVAAATPAPPNDGLRVSVEIPAVGDPPPVTPGPHPGSTYAGAGPGGFPLDGYAWKDHPSRRRYQTNWPINHNEVNSQECTEAFILGDGEKKIEEKIDTRTPNTTIFTFNKEDHTLANLLRDKLLKNSHVTFAAYRIPHPLFAKFELRVQTDGEITPKEAIIASSSDLVQELNVLKTEFTREYELRKMVGGTQNGP